MSNIAIKGKGSCLCGKVRFSAKSMGKNVGACIVVCVESEAVALL